MKKRNTIIIAVVSIIVFGLLSFLVYNKFDFKKINNMIFENKDKRTLYINNNISSISLLLNDINSYTNKPIEGSKIKIYLDGENGTISLYDALSNEVLEKDENDLVVIPENGIKINLNNIEKNNVYLIRIEVAETPQEYESMFKKALVKVEYTEEGKINASVVELKIDEEGEEQIIENDHYLMFMYADDEGNINIDNNDDVEIYYTFADKNGYNDEELENASWAKYDKENGFVAKRNGILYVKSKYKNGKYSAINSLNITNIDKLPPQIRILSITENDSKDDATVVIEVDDQDETNIYGKSGLKGYAITIDEEEIPEDYIDFNGGELTVDNITENGTHYFYAIDNVGNVTTLNFDVDVISFYHPENFGVILDASNHELKGRAYQTLNELLDDLKANGMTADSGEITIQLMKEIKNEQVVIDGLNIKLDLNGHNLSSRIETPVIQVKNNSRLLIVDNKLDKRDYLSNEIIEQNELNYSSGEGHSRIYAPFSNGIVVDETSTLILGEDNSPSLADIEYPDHEAPFIEAKDTGIINNGELYYYDGVIQARHNVEGEITGTPPLYEPTIERDPETKKFIMALEKVSGIEALIGKTRYSRLEDAIFVANNIRGDSNTEITIDLVTSITRPEPIVIDETKYIKLDLNGNQISTSGTDVVLINYGKFNIADSGNGRGKVHSSVNNVIVNKLAADLTISDGTIQVDTNKNAIYNEGGIVNINGGVVKTNAVSAAIYNLNILGNEKKVLYKSDFSDIVDDGDWHFVLNDNNELVNNNQGKQNTIANSYLPIDLTSYDTTKRYFVSINAEVSSESGYDFGYVVLNDSTETPTFGDETGRIINLAGSISGIYNSNSLEAGKMYYLHLGYRKDGSRDNGTDTFNIKSVRVLEYINYEGKINVSGGTITNIDNGNSYAIYDDANTDSITVSGGTINKLYNKYSNVTVEITGGTIQNLINTGTVNISGGTVTCNNNTATSIVNISGGINHNITNYNNSAKVNVSGGHTKNLYNNQGQITINGGNLDYIRNSVSGWGETTTCMDIKNATIDIFDNYSLCELNIEDSNITDMLRNYRTSTINLINTDFNKKASGYNDRFIHNEAADAIINIDNMEANINYSTPVNGNATYYGIVNVSNGIFNIKNSSIIINNTINNRSSYYDNYTYGVWLRDSASLKIEDTIVEVNQIVNSTVNVRNDYGYGIYTNSSGNIDVLGNSSVICSEKNLTDRTYSYGIVSNHSGKITIGEKDGNYNINQISIKGQDKAISNQESAIDFYDGSLYGNIVVDSSVHETEDEYHLNIISIEDDEDLGNTKKGYLTTEEQNNFMIVETGEYYQTLGEAMTAIETNNYTIQALAENIYTTLNENYTIEENQNFKIDLNGKNIFLGNGLIINGKLDIIDNNTEDRIAQIRTKVFNINGEMNIKSGNYMYEADSLNGIIIDQNGKLTIRNSSHQLTIGGISVENIIDNYGELYLEEGTYLTTSNFSKTRVITNNKGKVIMNDGEIYISTGYYNGANLNDVWAINNIGGEIEINGGSIHSNVIGRLIYNQTTFNGVEKNATNGFYLSDNVLYTNRDGTKSYIELDLSEYDESEVFNISINAVSGNSSFFQAYVTETTDVPSGEDGRLFNGNLTPQLQEITGSITGGKKYYLHLLGNYYCIIQKIEVKSNEHNLKIMNVGKLTINDGELYQNSDNNMIYNSNAEIVMNGGSIYKVGTVYGSAFQNNYYGKIKMTGGELRGMHTGIVNRTTGEVEITGGSITGVRLGVDSVTGTLKISDVTIKATVEYDGVYLDNTSAVITGGTIEGRRHGVYVANTGSSLTLGIDDGEVSQSNPSIKGDQYGVYNIGTFNFYDGIIKGKIDRIYGSILDKAHGYELIYDNEEDLKTVYLGKVEVVQNVDTTVKYYDLNEALERCDDICNLKMLYSYVLNDIIVNDKYTSIDVNGKEIMTSNNKYFVNNNKMTLSNGNISINSGENYESIIVNNGELFLEDGIYLTTQNFNKVYVITNNKTGKTVMNGGEIYISTGYNNGANLNNVWAINNIGGEIEINGGSIHSNVIGRLIYNQTTFNGVEKNATNGFYLSDNVLYTNRDGTKSYIELDLSEYDESEVFNISINAVSGNSSFFQAYVTETTDVPSGEDGRLFNGNLTPQLQEITGSITGGKKYYLHLLGNYYCIIQKIEVKSNEHNLKIMNVGKLTINDGELYQNSDNNMIYNSNAEIVMNGGSIYKVGTVYGSAFQNNYYGKIKMTGGELRGMHTGIVNRTTGEVEITGGSITGVRLGVDSVTGTLKISDVTIKATVEYDGVYLDNTSAVITGGTIEGRRHGVYVANTGSSLTLGIDDGEVSQSNPSIKGDQYGVYNIGTFNFYDGIIKGKIDSIYGKLTVKDSNSELIFDIEDDLNTVVLGNADIILNEDTGDTYKLLENAISECNESVCNFKILYPFMLTNKIVIPKNKEVNIDINQKNIKTSNIYYFENNGTLKVSNGKIIITSGGNNESLIVNNGDLYIEEGAYLTTSNFPNTRAITNNITGKVIMNGGEIYICTSGNNNGLPGEVIAINNIGGYVEINGGKIHSRYSGARLIYNQTTFNGLIKNGNNGFYIDNNTILGNSYDTYSYFELDLSEYDENEEFNVSLKAMSGNKRLFKVYITETTNVPNGNDGKIFDDNLTSELQEITGSINGGKKYYLHLYSRYDVRIPDIQVKSSEHEIKITNKGKVVINDGELTQDEYWGNVPIITNVNATNVINSGTISKNSVYDYDVYNNFFSDFIMNGGIIKNSERPIHLNNMSTANLNSGTVTSTKVGVYIENGTLTIGNNDGDVSTTDPNIHGDQYAIYKANGTFNFYDGILSANTSEYYGNVDNIPKDYEIYKYNNTATLRLVSNYENTIEYNGIYFRRIEDVIDMIEASSTQTGVVHLWNNITAHETIEIPSSVNLTLYLEGNSIMFKQIDVGIINNGSLTIADSTENLEDILYSTISNDEGTVINNLGTLIIGQDNAANPGSPYITGETAIIGNEPTVIRGTITSTGNNGGLGSALMDAIEFRFMFNKNIKDMEPYTNGEVIQSSMPVLDSDDDLENWTKDDITIMSGSSINPTLNAYESVNRQVNKFINIKIEYYKNGQHDINLDELIERNILYDEEDYVVLDKDDINKVLKSISGYKLSHIYINDEEVNEIPERIHHESVIKVEYTKIKNPKTFDNIIYLVISAIISLGMLFYIYKKVTSSKEVV